VGLSGQLAINSDPAQTHAGSVHRPKTELEVVSVPLDPELAEAIVVAEAEPATISVARQAGGMRPIAQAFVDIARRLC
jgi:hypothetical protein